MATNPRQPKPTRKGAPEPARRIPAWTGARASPTFSPPNSSTPRPTSTAPPATQPTQTNGARTDNPQDRVLQSLSGLTGTTVTLLTKTAQRYEGVVASTSGEGDTTGVTLKDVKEITNPGAPLKEQLFIASTNIESWTSGPADAKLTNGDSFRTDSNISQKKGLGRERELQAWQPDGPAAPSAQFSQGDDATFGPGSTNTSWDQFAANKQLFNVETSFDEEVYTTKLDRSGADFKERERKAQRIAEEISRSGTSNPHIAEERNQALDDSGENEEDKYGAVVRSTNAYVPPGARKSGAPPAANNAAKTDVPQVSVNGPDGAAIASQTPPSSSKAPSPAPTANKPPADPLPAFRDFVTNEKQRLTQKRQALVKSEMDKRMADLVKFSQSFKLNKPIPDDLVPILAKDEDKQRAIREKATKDASSTQARNIGPSTTTATPSARGQPAAVQKLGEGGRKPSAPAPGAKTTNSAANQLAAAPGAAHKNAAATTKPTSDPSIAKAAATKQATNMFIQVIPPFKGSKPRQASQPANGHSNGSSSGAHGSEAGSLASAKQPSTPNSAATAAANAAAANRLNVNASSFRPNPKASSFTPGAPSPGTNASSASASASPKPKDTTPSTPNPFFGTRSIKKSAPVNIKDDFNPFKHNKVVDASAVVAVWPYQGKRYIQMFPPHQQQNPNQQHSPHMAPPGPPPIPPPSYEEDSAAQAAARGYMYYPQYAYGQPMMPGMPPPGPPGTFIPGPYMQHMPYPPGMPPNAMYAPPNMGQMPPQAYMQGPPPPGTYPPPPNGAGPRPSMPPTPIPSHTHPYYHQSPQLQHAVPYPMMMPPPPNGVPPHPGYEGGPAPPVQMGGHS